MSCSRSGDSPSWTRHAHRWIHSPGSSQPLPTYNRCIFLWSKSDFVMAGGYDRYLEVFAKQFSGQYLSLKNNFLRSHSFIVLGVLLLKITKTPVLGDLKLRSIWVSWFPLIKNVYQKKAWQYIALGRCIFYTGREIAAIKSWKNR